MGVEAQAGSIVGSGPVSRLDQRIALFVWLVVLNVLDVVTTGLVLDAGGHELNPIIQPIVDSLLSVTLLKAAVLGVVGVLLTRARPSMLVDAVLTLVTGWYIAVVVWNTAVLFMI